MSSERNFFTQTTSLLGRVTQTDGTTFHVQCRSGDVFCIEVGAETNFVVLRNIDGLDRDRVQKPDAYDPQTATPAEKTAIYIRDDELVAVQGVYMEHGGRQWFDATTITLMHADQGQYVFEDTHWWLAQISRFADEWLDDLFDDRRNYEWDDFAKLYRTNLNILGLRTDDQIQECATLSRLIYGLSSAYMLTGSERYRLAARAGVKYQRETFRSLSHDGKYCFWMFGKRKRERGQHLIIASENPDDANTIPLYEQIYALSGLCQYYRISQSWDVLEDVRRTIRTFQDFYRDHKEYGYGEEGGYFSHIDHVTLRPDVDELGDNRLRKNWNSIGDHIPAYLVNLLLALDPLPRGGADQEAAQELLNTCREILEETASLILEKFPDDGSRFVNERFDATWNPDHEWRWQKNRAIVGHNFKIAWNMTRVAHYYMSQAAEIESESSKDQAQVVDFRQRASRLHDFAKKLADDMTICGIDQIRGGCFDAVERNPSGERPIQFVWGNTKDFWQQEQAILAYLIVHGSTGDQKYLELAREIIAFWNLYFLDHDNRGVYFRVSDIGQPVLQGTYSQKAGHAIAGYHSFELNYLAHAYIRTYVSAAGKIKTPTGRAAFPTVDMNFCLFFHPDANCPHTTINVLPDFVPPGLLEVAGIIVKGIRRSNFSPDRFQIELEREDLGGQIIVEFRPKTPAPRTGLDG